MPLEQRVPVLRTGDILTSTATGTIGGSIMDHAYNVEYSQTWSGGIQYALRPSTIARVPADHEVDLDRRSDPAVAPGQRRCSRDPRSG